MLTYSFTVTKKIYTHVTMQHIVPIVLYHNSSTKSFRVLCCTLFHAISSRGGSGQFFSPRVGFRVFWFCSGRVSGFGFFFRVKRKISRVTSGQKNLCSGQTRVKNFCLFDIKIHKNAITRQKFGQKWPKFGEKCKKFALFPTFFNFGLLGSGKNCLGLRKNYYGLARVLQNIARVGSGWAKHPRVGSNLGLGFNPTHPYL